MCPTTTAGPPSPGVGPCVYQPVTPHCFGVWIVPSWLSPSGMTFAETPIAGIAMCRGGAGSESLEPAACSARAARIGPGAGSIRVTGGGCSDREDGATAKPTAIRIPLAIKSAGTWRVNALCVNRVTLIGALPWKPVQ